VYTHIDTEREGERENTLLYDASVRTVHGTYKATLDLSKSCNNELDNLYTTATYYDDDIFMQ